jgi:hypothetical protein
LLTRGWRLPRWTAAVGVALAFVNPITTSLLQSTMAEPLFVTFSFAALYLASPGPRADDSQQQHTALRLCAAGALAAAAYLTRSIGAAVIAGVVLDRLLQRRWRQAGVVAILPLAAVVAWQTWCRWATTANAAQPAYPALGYDLDYGTWLPGSLAALAWVIYQNCADLLFSAMETILYLPQQWVFRALLGGSAGGWIVYAVIVVANLLIVLGWLATWRRARSAAHFYLVVYGAAVLAWPFQPVRFVAPLLPLLIPLLLGGVYQLAFRPVRALLGDRAEPAHRKRKPSHSAGRPAGDSRARTLAVRVTAVVALFMAIGPLRFLLVPEPRHIQALAREQQEREDSVELVQTHTPPDAVIASSWGAYMYLRTGRKAVAARPIAPPVAVFYPPDRHASRCGLGSTVGAREADEAFLRARLLTHFRVTGATHVIPPPGTSSYNTVFDEWQRADPQVLRPIASKNDQVLYEVFANRRPRATDP